MSAVKAAGGIVEGSQEGARQDRLKLTDELQDDGRQAAARCSSTKANGDAEKHAKYFRDKVVPAMTALRETGDSLEAIVPHDMWPLPTYREMLFVR